MLNVKIFTFSPIAENTYLLYNENKECIIIDPGCYTDKEREELLQFIRIHKLVPALLLNTHCHLDHVFGNKFVHEEFGLTLHIHPEEKPVLDFAPAAGLMWNLPFDNYQGEINYLEEGETIKIGDDELEILFTPGHSPGSISFYCRKQNFVISGDVLFSLSIGRADLPGGNFNVLAESIRKQLYTLPDETIVYPGHGPETTTGFEKANNPFVKATG
ncbi:MAG: MBL fold metallo-hydrolase [Chitinophagaceae bacterium]|nr:MBL fold metallo-hydrolase [Chitinophagaceae bacterium]